MRKFLIVSTVLFLLLGGVIVANFAHVELSWGYLKLSGNDIKNTENQHQGTANEPTPPQTMIIQSGGNITTGRNSPITIVNGAEQNAKEK